MVAAKRADLSAGIFLPVVHTISQAYERSLHALSNSSRLNISQKKPALGGLAKGVLALNFSAPGETEASQAKADQDEGGLSGYGSLTYNYLR